MDSWFRRPSARLPRILSAPFLVCTPHAGNSSPGNPDRHPRWRQPQEAAERLHLTQSALSHQLRDLETRLGTPLLNRRTRPARLTTAAGLRVLALADEVLPRMRATERELQRLAAGRSGRLHLAIDCHSCFQWLMPALDAFRAQWPDVALDLSAAFSFAPLPALVRGDLDLVITSDPQPLDAVDYLPCSEYELVLAVSESNPWPAASSSCRTSWRTRR